ncbi:hypothetical protein BJY52DRAFT_1191759 [Lactarius psammicola]|nr:hypothetical protein BJY52DRAFT_1191759 [Lactarius psammicola]
MLGRLAPSSGNVAPDLDADGSTDSQANDRDYRVGGSDESKESSPSSEAGPCLDPFNQRHLDRPRGKAGPGPSAERQHYNSGAKTRSIQAATLQAEDAFSKPRQTPGGFSFLHLESYTCNCASPTISKPSPSQCKVLAYFAMIFHDGLQVVYCLSHSQIIPMSEWATHVRGSHLDWSSGTKKSDCEEMAKHVAHGHCLSMDQTIEDLHLPGEIDEPLSTSTSNLHLNYKCPLGCGVWSVKDKKSSQPERYIRRHIKNDCEKNKDSKCVDVHLDDPRWVFKVKISGKQNKHHSFVLPPEWERGDDEELAAAPDFPPLAVDNAPHSEGLGGGQKWPVTLGWCAYDQEISASNHIDALRRLILLPRCKCRSKTPSYSHFLEKGLHLVDHAVGRYLRSATLFVHEKHRGVLDAITSECAALDLMPCAINNILSSSKKAQFRILSDGKISEYRRPFSMAICMMLNFIHDVLTNDAEKLGLFKLRGVRAQFIAALALYRLIVKNKGDILENTLDWATHDVLEALLKPMGLGTRPVDCPTDQMAFLWSFLSSSRYRISKDLSSLMAGCKFGFRCTEIHIARIQSQKRNRGSPFYDAPYAEGESDAESLCPEGESDKEGSEPEVLPLKEENRCAAGGRAEPDIGTLLAKANAISFEDVMDVPPNTAPGSDATAQPYEEVTDALILQILTDDRVWLSSNPQDLESTPYGRVAHIQHTISPYTRIDGTLTHINISRDGQIATYSTNGAIWRSIDYGMWSTFIFGLISRIGEAVANQMPSGMVVSDLKGQMLSDDLSEMAPHKQEKNTAHMERTMDGFLKAMASPTESRHRLYSQGGLLNNEAVMQYVMRDQEIKGLLCALLTSCSAVPMRPWQFGSIVFDSCKDTGRNVWIVGNRFVTGKPVAKQLNVAFADTIFWLPSAITSDLTVLLYYQQPFISSLLEETGIPDLLYASHVWALPSIASREIRPKVWNGQEVNRKVRDLTQQLIGSPIDVSLARQSSQGLLRDKIPALFEIFQCRDNLYLKEGSYQHQPCLEAYATHHNLKRLAHAAKIQVNRASACLIVCDIWQSMHGVVQADPIWGPMVAGSYIFPSIAHDASAFLGAQSLKMIENASSRFIFDQDNLTQGVILLTSVGLLEDMATVDPIQAAAGRCFLKTVRTILFGEGRPRYGQTPPIGGIPLCDLVKAGAMILYAGKQGETSLPFKDVLKDANYLDTYRTLHQRWEGNEIQRVAISAAVFDIHPTTNSKTAMATAKLLDIVI